MPRRLVAIGAGVWFAVNLAALVIQSSTYRDDSVNGNDGANWLGLLIFLAIPVVMVFTTAALGRATAGWGAPRPR